MIKILVADALAQDGVDFLLQDKNAFSVDIKTGLSKQALLDIIGQYEALIVRSATQVTADIIASGKKLKIIGRAGIGVDNIDIHAATQHRILVMNTPQGNIVTTAEHAIAMIMALSRHIPQATASMKSGIWDKKSFIGQEITGKTLGILGLGNIGKIVAQRAQGLQMQVIAHDPYLTHTQAHVLGVTSVTLKDLYKQSDYISIHTPLTSSTKHMINKDAFEQMKPSVMLIQCARGGIIDEQALLKALQNNQIKAAALDVFEEEPTPKDHPLILHPRVICTPHLGASTHEAQMRVSLLIAEQIVQYFKSGKIENAVNGTQLS